MFFFVVEREAEKNLQNNYIFHSTYGIIYRDLFIRTISTYLSLLEYSARVLCYKYLIMPYPDKKSQTLMIRKIREYFLRE